MSDSIESDARATGLSGAGGSPVLVEIGERLRTQDNRITQNPMFCVQQKRRVYGIDPRWSDNCVWYRNGEQVEDGDEDNAERVGYYDYWETVMVAFTEGGCKEYLRQNGHNLREPRIYVESFNRCPEMIAVRQWLIDPPNIELRDAR